MSLCVCGSPYCEGCPATERLTEERDEARRLLDSAQREIRDLRRLMGHWSTVELAVKWQAQVIEELDAAKLQVGEMSGALKAIAAGEGGHNHEDKAFWTDCASCWVYKFAEKRVESTPKCVCCSCGCNAQLDYCPVHGTGR